MVIEHQTPPESESGAESKTWGLRYIIPSLNRMNLWTVYDSYVYSNLISELVAHLKNMRVNKQWCKSGPHGSALFGGELDPDLDPQQSEKSNPKALHPAGRCGAHNRAMEAHFGAAVANNGTKEAHSGVLEGLQASGSDTQHFDEEPDSHRFKRSDTDPH